MRNAVAWSLFSVLAVSSFAGAAQAAPVTTWTLDVSAYDALPRLELVTALGRGSRSCLEDPRFDALANGYGSLFVVVDRAGEVRDASYLGFDVAPNVSSPFEPADLARKQRARFDDLGTCLRAAALGARIGTGQRAEPAAVMVRFVPVRGR